MIVQNFMEGSDLDDIAQGKQIIKKYFDSVFSYYPYLREKINVEKMMIEFGGKNDRNFLALGLGIDLNLQDGTLTQKRIDLAISEIAKIYKGDLPPLSAWQTILVKNAGNIDMEFLTDVYNASKAQVIPYIQAAGAGIALYYLIPVLAGIAIYIFNIYEVRNKYEARK
jgi:hypothetical protein